MWVVLVALPGLALAGAGIGHPGYLDASTAQMRWPVHVALLPVFPLLGAVGTWSSLLATVVTGGLLIRRRGVRAVPGTVVPAGAVVPFLTPHIFWPVGVATMAATAVGAALLEASRRGRPAVVRGEQLTV
jgi:hypothetical protein